MIVCTLLQISGFIDNYKQLFFVNKNKSEFGTK